jgi:hypothetical protein
MEPARVPLHGSDMQANPFAPPGSDEAPPTGELVFSPEGIRVVESLAAWMRGLGVIYFVGAAFVAVFSLFAIGMIGPFAVVGWVGVALLGAGGWLLREAGGAFARGVRSDDELTIGQGFGRLRSYFLLIGVFTLLGLAGTLFNAVGMVMS